MHPSPDIDPSSTDRPTDGPTWHPHHHEQFRLGSMIQVCDLGLARGVSSDQEEPQVRFFFTYFHIQFFLPHFFCFYHV